jgi:hypothetical protein
MENLLGKSTSTSNDTPVIILGLDSKAVEVTGGTHKGASGMLERETAALGSSNYEVQLDGSDSFVSIAAKYLRLAAITGKISKRHELIDDQKHYQIKLDHYQGQTINVPGHDLTCSFLTNEVITATSERAKIGKKVLELDPNEVYDVTFPGEEELRPILGSNLELQIKPNATETSWGTCSIGTKWKYLRVMEQSPWQGGGPTQRNFRSTCTEAIVQRLQQSCGLTTSLNKTFNGKNLICTIQADSGDLVTEAARTEYRLQLLNRPFAPASGQYTAYMKGNGICGDVKIFDAAIQHLSTHTLQRGDWHSDPVLDPQLMTKRNRSTKHNHHKHNHQAHDVTLGASSQKRRDAHIRNPLTANMRSSASPSFFGSAPIKVSLHTGSGASSSKGLISAASAPIIDPHEPSPWEKRHTFPKCCGLSASPYRRAEAGICVEIVRAEGSSGGERAGENGQIGRLLQPLSLPEDGSVECVMQLEDSAEVVYPLARDLEQHQDLAQPQDYEYQDLLEQLLAWGFNAKDESSRTTPCPTHEMYVAPYVPYVMKMHLQPLFRRYGDAKHETFDEGWSLFRPVDRIRLAHGIIMRHLHLGAGLQLYCMHTCHGGAVERHNQRELAAAWAKVPAGLRLQWVFREALSGLYTESNVDMTLPTVEACWARMLRLAYARCKKQVLVMGTVVDVEAIANSYNEHVAKLTVREEDLAAKNEGEYALKTH